ncbi:Na+/H+ antiporter NhaC family protein [Clostridium butyricum]|uniref:Na+/H+ antiporter NhaC family protein n=1 Tax=Clostridium butyricum TaxID=1492 RepID=UPI0013D0DC50|nr:Na+/H+ antiporter NhaC family protein [Clostridium butyricum]MCQ2015914.1 Na+/H+ antiporter NhaC family protein [Clostridium butyricum]MCQ2019986.1 Na+/H+ antiporter NhaC family protein [Clostridium butyricum]NFB70310.1 Na+/H+ antiporter NhaC family protein [Clostridium butyricum]NFB90785.1 Na+/H+ antiporter NhaC family protein [Clostridium butyricum]UTY51655.1 Na+/H+ antiporter NhaC family protein [Clostridium butyricum]
MKNFKKYYVFLLTLVVLMMPTVAVFASDDVAGDNAAKFGLLTILPPLVAIALAFITKNVVISLFLGTLSGCFLLQISGNNIIYAIVNSFLDFVQRALNSLADPWNAGIVLQVMVIGGVISLVSKMGGAKAIAEALAKRAKTPRSAQLITWLLGILVFFDDYANSLIVGPIMKPVADKMKISREKLSFIIDATAAPIAGIMIISTWIGLEVGLIKDGFESIGQSADAFGVFLNTIPYRFYNILILIFVVATSYFLRDFGPMRKAEIKARKGQISETNKEIALDKAAEDEMAPKEGVKLSIWNAIIPIGALMISALISFYYSGYTSIMGGEDAALQAIMTNSPMSFTAIREAFSASDASVALFQSALFASIVAIAMGVGKKIFTFSEAVDVWVDGMKGLIITGVILILAWSLSSVIKELGTAAFLVRMLSNSVPKFLLPSIIFILGAVISFATGTAYGTMGILMPLAIPLSYSISPDFGYVVISTSAVLTGAIFGDHCSPISDTTIMSSMGAGCNHIDHVKTQMPYALTVAAITVIFGYIPAGLGISVWIVLPIAAIVTCGVVYFVGKPVDNVEE